MMRRIKKLEDSVYDENNFSGTLRLDSSDLPEAEQALLQKVVQIAQTHNYEDLDDAQLELLEKGFQRIEFRVFTLFSDIMSSGLEGLDKVMFQARLMWLIYEATNVKMQRIQETDILNNTSTTDEQKEELLKQFDNEPVLPFCSEEKWTKYYEEHVKPLLTKMFDKTTESSKAMPEEEEVVLQGEPEPIKPFPMSMAECLGLDKIPKVTE